MSSCAHLPLVRDVLSPDQSHTVRPSFPFPTSPQCCCFFFTGNTREQISIPTSQIRADDRLQDQKNAMCDPGVHRQSASLHHQPSLVRMWSINNRTLKHLYVLQPAARSLQKEDPQQTNEQNSFDVKLPNNAIAKSEKGAFTIVLAYHRSCNVGSLLLTLE
jgi:hypothetical protein